MTGSAASCLLLTCGALALWGSAASAQADDRVGELAVWSASEGQGVGQEDDEGDESLAAADGELVSTLAGTEQELQLLEAELASIGASLRSAGSTSAWLTQRIDDFSAQASALAMGEEELMLMGLSIRLADIDGRRAAAMPAVLQATEEYDAMKAALVAAVVAEQLFEQIETRAQVARESLRSVSRASDAMVREVCRLNVEVESVHGALAALRGELASQGDVALTPPTWLDSEPVVELSTSQGELVLALRPDVAPRHVENFRRLVEAGFYDGLTFHRVVPDFVIQGGDPLGTGMGGPGWQIPSEFNDLPHLRGTLSMARMGQWDTAGSQFFFCLDDWSQELDRKYTVFGKVLRGLATLDNMAALGSASGVPSETISIHKAVLRERRPTDVPDER